MGALRITPKMLAERSLRHIQTQARKLMDLQEQLATGCRVNRPSDDPINARLAVNTRGVIQKNTQYVENIAFVTPNVVETDMAIVTVMDAFNRSWELTLQAVNGTNQQGQIDQIAVELNQLLESILDSANHESNNRYIFGGTKTSQPPYVETRNAVGEIVSVAYQGNTDDVLVKVSDTVNLKYNEPGPDVFDTDQDIFQLLIAIRDELRAGNTNNVQQVRLAEMDQGREQLLTALARVGSVQNRMDRVSLEHTDFNIHLHRRLSDAIDADFAELITDFNAQSNAYEAALNAAARAMAPSLMDYVR